jgi:NAD(P)-dependent dehydrogenase (short-subunit alcohol dehydrogenase family)
MAHAAVLITGCSSGIGEALARGLNTRGYRVFATARRSADVSRLAAAGLESLPLDVDSSESIEACVTQVLSRTQGRLFALINNAGYQQPGAVEDVSRDALRQQFETNLFGVHELTCRLMPVFRAQGCGRIVQVSSLLGYVSLAYRGAYNASKHALEGLTDTLRLELRGTGIHPVLIEPGPIRSRFRRNSLAALRVHVAIEGSVHRRAYEAVVGRLASPHDAPFTLPSEAVLPKVIRALESRRPRDRYRVTVPAHLGAWLARALPTRWLDPILAAVSNVSGGSGRGGASTADP